MTTEKQAVKTIADAILKAVRTVTEENNRKFVNNQIKNFGGNADSGSTSGGSYSGTIPASQVTGLYNVVAGYIVNAQSSSEGGDVIAGKILSALSDIASIQVGQATIGYAQIDDLKAGVAEIVHLTAESAEIEDATIRQLKTDIAKVGIADIGRATIGYAQIKDLSTGSAIITEGEANKLRIDRLAVTDANMVSLTAGEIMLKNTEGEFVRLVVDGTGNVSSEVVTFDGDDVLNDDSLNAKKIIENSITARELNVSKIFADQALIRAIKAQNIDTDDLFADNGFINNLYTNTIRARSAGTDIDISENSAITLLNGRIGLIVEDGSSSSSLTLTPAMISAVGEQIELKADTIDFSANESITEKVQTEVQNSIYYRMDIYSTSDILTSTKTSTTLSIKLYKGNSDITSNTPESSFIWTRSSGNTVADLAWNASHINGSKSLIITRTDVINNALFQCNYVSNSVTYASVSKSIVDMADNGRLFVSLGSNLPTTQIFDEPTNSYAPDWTSTNLVITPSVMLNENVIENTDSNLSVVWKRKKSDGVEYNLTTGETVNNKQLTVSQNKLGDETSGLIAYVAHVSYTNQDGTTSTATSEVTFSMVKNGEGGEKGPPGEKGDPGDRGESAVVLLVYTPNGNTFMNNTGTLLIQAVAYYGTQQITSGASFSWKRYESGSWITISGADSDSLTISGSEVSGVASYKCVMIYDESVYEDVVSLTDKTDNFQAVIESTGGSIFKNTLSSTDLKCRLFQGGSEVDASGSIYTCWWYKLNKDGNSTIWHNGAVRKAGKSISVNGNDVDEKTTFVCEVIDQRIGSGNGLKTSSQFTIVDLNDPIQSGEEPDNPIIDTLWVDTSSTPNELKRWNGSEWVSVSNYNPEELELEIERIETEISQQNGEILLRATKEELTQVDDKVTANQIEIALIETRYDNITLAVGKKSTNYRQKTQPENPNTGDIWVKPTTIIVYDTMTEVEESYQALGAVGSGKPVFAYDSDGNLLYDYDEDLITDLQIRIDDNANLQILADGTYSIVDNELEAAAEWKKLKGNDIAQLEITVDGINSIVTSHTGEISAVTQQADKINWIVSDGTSESSMTLTSTFMDMISNDIDLRANDSVRIFSGDQIKAEAMKSIKISSADQIEVSAINELDLSSNKVVIDIKSTTDNVDNWFDFSDEGLRVREKGSSWSTLTANEGYYIDHDEVGHVAAFRKETLEVRSIQIGEITARRTSNGGWVWTD